MAVPSAVRMKPGVGLWSGTLLGPSLISSGTGGQACLRGTAGFAVYEGGSRFTQSADLSREVKILKCYMKWSHFKNLANLENMYLKYGGPNTTSVGQILTCR